MTIIRSQVLGLGAYLPSTILTNEELARRVDTSDDWITERTGIRSRRVAAQGEMTSHLAHNAALAALSNAGVKAEELDLIVVATTTPDETFPSVATIVQARLGMTRGAAFDIQAVCSGFIYGLAVADNFIRCGQAKTVLLIGAETMSRLMDWTDRTTCVLFGDGAGAVVLRAAECEGTSADRGILTTQIYSDGRLHDLLYVDGGPSSTQTTGHLRMQGKEVFKHAINNITSAVHAAAEAAGVSVNDVDWFIPHQANQRILDGTAKKLGVPGSRTISTIAEHGNTSAASVPLALATAVADGRVKRGQLLLLEAMGGGFTWGSALIRW
ncbi:MAG: beta-ketoacyl-ACP synthase III [Alphaproteobacteria bacterium]|nr:beta-ketoacyl-ACP synthase III [Alphaproteobacteria bacterium]